MFLLFILQMVTSCEKIQKIYEARNDASLAKARYWPQKSIPQIGAKCRLSTSWREGKLYFIFEAEPLVDPNESFENKSAPQIGETFRSKLFAHSLDFGYGLPIFTAKLTDKAGFEIISIEMTETSRIVDNDNKPVGLQQKSSIECSRTNYQNLTGWEVSWRK